MIRNLGTVPAVSVSCDTAEGQRMRHKHGDDRKEVDTDFQLKSDFFTINLLLCAENGSVQIDSSRLYPVNLQPASCGAL